MVFGDRPIGLDYALTVLDNQTRRTIFDVLWHDLWDSADDERGLSFEELRQRTGIEQSSKLNYHLQIMKEVGTDPEPLSPEEWVGETPIPGSSQAKLVIQEDGRYRLSYAQAMRIVRTWQLLLPDPGGLPPTEVSWNCLYCGEGLIATYANHRFDLWCDTHQQVDLGVLVPGTPADQSMDDIVRLGAFERSRRTLCSLNGMCPVCWGPLSGDIVLDRRDRPAITELLSDETSFPRSFGDYAYSLPDHKWEEPFVKERCCQRCGFNSPSRLGYLACHHPAIMAYLQDHGVDVLTEPMTRRFVRRAGTVHSADPLRIEVEIIVDGNVKSFIVDSECRVHRSEA